MASGSDAKRKARKKNGIHKKSSKARQRKTLSKGPTKDFLFHNPKDKKGVASLELRKKTLGVEFANRGKTNSFKDRRDNDRNKSEEERSWERLIKQRKSLDKTNIYKLEDDDSGGLMDEQSLGFNLSNKTYTENDEIPKPEGGDNIPVRKTKMEIMKEVMLKCKLRKAEKQTVQNQMESEIEEVDQMLSDVTHLLRGSFKRTKDQLQRGAKGASDLLESKIQQDKIPESSNHDTNMNSTTRESSEPKKVRFLLANGDTVSTGGGSDTESQDNEDHTNQNKITEEEPVEDETPVPDVDIKDADYDEIEKMFQRDMRGNVPSKRTPTEDEILQEAQKLLDEKKKRMNIEVKEANEEGDDDNDNEEEHEEEEEDQDINKAKNEEEEEVVLEERKEKRLMEDKLSLDNTLDILLQEFEEECVGSTSNGRPININKINSITTQIINLSRLQVTPTSTKLQKVMMSLYEDWQLYVLKCRRKTVESIVRPIDIYGAMFCKLITVCYPCSDFRHPLCSPVALWIAATLTNTMITNLHHLTLGMFRVSLLLEMTSEAKRFSQESLNFLNNALICLCPAEHQKLVKGTDRTQTTLPLSCPELLFTSWSLLYVSKKELNTMKSNQEDDEWINKLPLEELSKSIDTPLRKLQITKTLYIMLGYFSNLYSSYQTYPEIFAPTIKILTDIEEFVPLPLRKRHTDLLNGLKENEMGFRLQRKPVMFQTHRPVPLRLYDPDIKDDRREKTTQQIKKVRRDHFRQAQKSIRADTRFLQKAREEEQAIDDKRRLDKYNQIVHDLQEQRHMVGEMELKWKRKREALASKKMKDAAKEHKKNMKDSAKEPYAKKPKLDKKSKSSDKRNNKKFNKVFKKGR